MHFPAFQRTQIPSHSTARHILQLRIGPRTICDLKFLWTQLLAHDFWVEFGVWHLVRRRQNTTLSIYTIKMVHFRILPKAGQTFAKSDISRAKFGGPNGAVERRITDKKRDAIRTAPLTHLDRTTRPQRPVETQGVAHRPCQVIISPRSL